MIGVQKCQPGCAEPSSLVERLRAPLWEHSAAMFCGPKLSQEETLADLNAAADRIEELTKALRPLVNELTGFLGNYSHDMRYAAGNTNVAVLQHKLDAAASALPLERSGGAT